MHTLCLLRTFIPQFIQKLKTNMNFIFIWETREITNNKRKLDRIILTQMQMKNGVLLFW